MAEEERTPLLAERADADVSERTPLIARSSSAARYDGSDAGSESAQPSKKSRLRQRWPSIVALVVLSILFILALVAGFVAPTVAEKYAKEAAVFNLTHVSAENYSIDGVKARVQAVAVLDAARVRSASVRNIGRFLTSIAKKVEAQPSEMRIVLPEYGDAVLGYVSVPKIVVDIQNGHSNDLDFYMDLRPAGPDGIRRLAFDWLEGRVKDLRIKGEGNVKLVSGLFSLGSKWLSETIKLPVDKVPDLPKFKLDKVFFHPPTNDSKDMLFDANVIVENNYPLNVFVPPVAIDLLVPNCLESDPYLRVATINSDQLSIKPYQALNVSAHGVIRKLTEDLTKICPRSQSSPLDILLRSYVQGRKTTVFVQGSREAPEATPAWLEDLMAGITVPVVLPSHPTKDLIKNFSLTDVHLVLPNPAADPDTPEGRLRISALIKALVGIPKELKFPVNVTRVKAVADVFYHEKKLGELNLNQWQKANSSRVDLDDDTTSGLLVQAAVVDAPLNVTDDDLFTEIIQKLIFGGSPVSLGVKAKVDVEVDIVFGKPIVRAIPAEGKITVKPIGHGFGNIKPQINSIQVLDTTPQSISLQANVNVTNPTPYSASVPFLSLHVLKNGSTLAEVLVRDLSIVPGPNVGVVAEASWNPTGLGGSEGAEIGRRLISQYVSGDNSTLIVRTHEGTFPSQPKLGKALAALPIEIPIPHLTLPKSPDDDEGDGRPHFVNDATLHIFSSTATFILLSPFKEITLYVTSINATAFYNHTEPVGHIEYELPFAVPPGNTTTPRLPVDWNIGDVGFDAVKNALGGSLKLDASAWIGVKIGQFMERLWYEGHGMKAKVRV